ncbi:hypothetical protein JQU17_13085 [Ponticoccus sp. SC2-23]|uniref:HlyU family transcriptional regulator n=1 Tax=Alexandriicola marinus TaxID=2081710 RepID=UPI000FDB6850|nr:HlyU family transcriptional regulator [Alexandriicola marinus]MBM1221161.1 hypothetical protein [Ponticoccus sp. SC6-9]MBM1225731.1 hypothetical protein [Ponticoccus sp. SC6-15]MBM1227883.1 hypothetical protein [Ponticoccus sp. SC6-38]MBM1234479.1 hypothetical protein [Ponticoccus sp. SC6-45]MBM1238385.1 hypothetical protein [Ponticoccus sp. SC6-49]MBM1243654.1 hypothetical protein [Ponticoccus sp. SC2-64]MBM1248003.1 hypothetical protein [Ponticoccus sp. SC6-42]MBM1252785.1 hypothetical
MSILSRLFGSKGTASEGGSSAGPAEEYNGFTITPEPIKEGGVYRVAARIEKDGKVHQLIRADTLNSKDDAAAASSSKARQMIDEQGDRIFD